MASPITGGLTIARRWTRPGEDPCTVVAWDRRTARITGEHGDTIFEQQDVEVPASWSQQALNVVARHYLRGAQGTPERETSVRQLVHRVVGTIAAWGQEAHVFASSADAEAFEDELTALVLLQRFAFNSPVWFNVGIEPHPQCSACFINSVKDTLESILELTKTEGLLFKYGSGTGTNLSPLRSSREPLAGGGWASGPVSFMRGYDAFAGAIKSGGKTRRAAKMAILDVSHPDIVEFIECKAAEERKAHALASLGYDASFGGEAYASVFFQNANHSVRVPDAFMEAALQGGSWTTQAVRDERPIATHRAVDLLRRAAEAAWTCGDPGLQFDTTINAWHTCPTTARINASNPCSEYMFLDDSACNLGSLNLLAFADRPEDDGGIDRRSFDVDGFRHAIELAIVAQELLVDRAGYPTAAISENSRRFRPLGLGYANLGALLLSWGLPYDSDAGRAVAAAITALLGGTAYAASAHIAATLGPFDGFAENREPMLAVIERHRAAAAALPPCDLKDAAHAAWEGAVTLGRTHGYRNAQTTVLAPTGTIAFMMDCDTTGVEPELALVKYKRLAGGGLMRLVNRAVPSALARLGYSPSDVAAIVAHIESSDTIEGAPALKDEHLPVFDCAFRAPGGARAIAPLGHLRMMAAVQPFLSGAISKTVNVPNDTTADAVMDLFIDAWRLGLKSIAVYRDGCKRAQPLSLPTATSANTPAAHPPRRRLPAERESLTHKFDVAGYEGYITVGKYPDGTPGEIFIVMAKQGSTVGGLMDSVATAVSLALQYGVPLEVLVKKFVNTRFEPSGFTGNPEIPIARSLMDYIFRWMALRFLDPSQLPSDEPQAHPSPPRPASTSASMLASLLDAPPCAHCGSLMLPAGACYECANCGETSGCS